jgi:hypothetical protein
MLLFIVIRTKGRNNDITREDFEDLELNISTKAKLSTWKIAFLFVNCLSARAFNRRFYGAMSGVSKPYHFIRVSRGMKEDIQVWLSFLDKFNGSNIFPDEIWVTQCMI